MEGINAMPNCMAASIGCSNFKPPAILEQGAIRLVRSRDLVSIRDELGRDCLAPFTPSTHQLH